MSNRVITLAVAASMAAAAQFVGGFSLLSAARGQAEADPLEAADQRTESEASRRADLERRAAEGDADAQALLGYMLRYGQGGPADPERARELLEAAVQSAPWAETGLAEMLRLGRGGPADAQRARSLFERRAAAGDPDALAGLGGMLLKGEGGASDLTKARSLLERAASAGSQAGKADLADMLRTGRGGAKDEARARTILESLVADGAQWAAPLLAGMLRRAEGGPRDSVGARELLTKAVAAGEEWGAADLAEMLRSGEGGQPDMARARSLFEMALGNGEEWVVETLAYMVLQSEGSGGGRDAALKLLRQNADEGNAVAQRVIGDFCMDLGPSPDFACAERQYELALEGGDQEALVRIAQVDLDSRRGGYRYDEAIESLRSFGRAAGSDALTTKLNTMNSNAIAVISEVFLQKSGFYNGSIDGLLTVDHIKSLGIYCRRSGIDCRIQAFNSDYRRHLAEWIAAKPAKE